MPVITEDTLRKLLTRAETAYSAKEAVVNEKLSKLSQMDREHPEEVAKRGALVDAVAGRIAAYDDLVAEGVMTDSERNALPEYKTLCAERDAKMEDKLRFEERNRSAIRAIQTEINESDLPELRRLRAKVEQYKEMLDALLEENEHPTITPPPAE